MKSRNSNVLSQNLSSSEMGKSFIHKTFSVALLLLITIMIRSTSSADGRKMTAGRYILGLVVSSGCKICHVD
ncbi:hypothetical protein C5167_029058 [Papaver somniferum]|nr:hypothetical protein C5167_029058 [Papaver somniferum]